MVRPCVPTTSVAFDAFDALGALTLERAGRGGGSLPPGPIRKNSAATPLVETTTLDGEIQRIGGPPLHFFCTTIIIDTRVLLPHAFSFGRSL